MIVHSRASKIASGEGVARLLDLPFSPKLTRLRLKALLESLINISVELSFMFGPVCNLDLSLLKGATKFVQHFPPAEVVGPGFCCKHARKTIAEFRAKANPQQGRRL